MAVQKILGIDPGSRKTGYALLVEEGRNFRAAECGVISTTHLEDQVDRLQFIYNKVTALLNNCSPTACAVETPVYGIDPLAMLKLGRAQAAALLAISGQNLPVAEYYPKAVKKSVTGNGNAGKEQVAWMLKKLIRLPDKKLSTDATDALAVAWCHLSAGGAAGQQSRKYHQNNRKSSWKAFVEENPDKIKSS